MTTLLSQKLMVLSKCLFESNPPAVINISTHLYGHHTILNSEHCLEEKEVFEYEEVVKRKWLYCAVESPRWPAIPQAHTTRHPFY